MATVNTFTTSATTVPAGGSADIAVTFSTAPGSPDLTARLPLLKEGVEAGHLEVVLTGTPAEATPVVTVGATGTGWEIRASAGTLVAGATPNTFKLTR